MKKKVAKSVATKKAEKLLGGPVTKQRKVVRDAATGGFVSKAEAKKNPKGTVTETVTSKRKGKEFKIPKTLPECVDMYDQLREERLALQKQAAELGEREGKLREHLIDNISKTSPGVIGSNKKVVVVVQPIPRVADEKAYFKFASRKGNEDLVKHVPDIKAIQERWDNGKTVPGVESFNVVKLSLTKIK